MIQYIMMGRDSMQWYATQCNESRYSNMQHVHTSGATSDNPRTCDEVPNDGLYNLDPAQDGLDPISVFCNTSSTPATAVLHHNFEEWTHVSGYEAAGSYEAKVWFGQIVPFSRECRERFPRHRRIAIPICIPARASRTCRDACRDR